MIDYDVLCQAIGDWKAGRAPTPVVTRNAGPPSPPSPPAHVVDEVDEVDEVAEFEDDDQLDELQEVVEEPQEQTIIYQLPIEPLDEDDL